MTSGVRVGTDVVAVDEVRESIARFGERYLQRTYTPGERRDCRDDPARLAARFAAKEALIKTLRDPDLATPLHDVETRLHGGLPRLQVSGHLASRLQADGMVVIGVSLSHTDCHAVATVLIASAMTP